MKLWKLMGSGKEKKNDENKKNLYFDFSSDFPGKLMDKNFVDLVYATGIGETDAEEVGMERDKCAQVRRGNFFDLYFTPKLTSLLILKYCQEFLVHGPKKDLGEFSNNLMENFKIFSLPCILCDSKIMKNHNILALGAGNVNSVAREVFSKYNTNSDILPIHFGGPSDYTRVLSEASEEPPYRDSVGILEVLPNPQNPSKIVIVCAGTDIYGTQAAVLALINGKDEEGNLLSNNKYDPTKPAKVVKPLCDREKVKGKYRIKKVTRFLFLE